MSARTSSVSGIDRIAPDRPDDERPEDDREEAQREAEVDGVAHELGLDEHLQRDVDDAVDRDDGEGERPAADDERQDRGRDEAQHEADVGDEVRDEREDRPHAGAGTPRAHSAKPSMIATIAPKVALTT